jgi:hypothetical protein
MTPEIYLALWIIIPTALVLWWNHPSKEQQIINEKRIQDERELKEKLLNSPVVLYYWKYRDEQKKGTLTRYKFDERLGVVKYSISFAEYIESQNNKE